MATVGARIVIDRAVDEVYSYVTDIRHDPQWWKGVRSCVRLTGDGGVGTTYQLQAKLLGVNVPTVIAVTQADPPRAMTIVASGRLPYTARYSFASTPEGTLLGIEVQIERSMWRRLAPLLAMVMRHHLRRLDRILTR